GEVEALGRWPGDVAGSQPCVGGEPDEQTELGIAPLWMASRSGWMGDGDGQCLDLVGGQEHGLLTAHGAREADAGDGVGDDGTSLDGGVQHVPQYRSYALDGAGGGARFREAGQVGAHSRPVEA